ncbi:MAG: helicase HerA domain-containing protein [Flammeovirgaceae bacterium]
MWWHTMIHQTSLIWGNQGGGKSWLARFIIQEKIKINYRIIVLDPDSNRSEWKGVESYHDHESIEKMMRWYYEELITRYREFSQSNIPETEWRDKLWSEGKAITLVIEEATTYSSFIKDSEFLSNFGKYALTKSRKQEMPILIIAHNNTQSCLFGISGLHNLVSKMLQVECLAEINEKTFKPVSTGTARIKLDSSDQWLLVKLPNQKNKITNFSQTKETPQDELLISEILGDDLKSILKFAIEKRNWISIRDILRKDFSALKNHNSEKIRELFLILTSKGYGETRNINSSFQFKVYGVEPLQDIPDS